MGQLNSPKNITSRNPSLDSPSRTSSRMSIDSVGRPRRLASKLPKDLQKDFVTGDDISSDIEIPSSDNSDQEQDDEDRPLALKKKKKRLIADITELIQLSDSDEGEAEGEDDNFDDAVAANIDSDILTFKRFDIRVDCSEFERGFLATLPLAKVRLIRIQTPKTAEKAKDE